MLVGIRAIVDYFWSEQSFLGLVISAAIFVLLVWLAGRQRILISFKSGDKSQLPGSRLGQFAGHLIGFFFWLMTMDFVWQPRFSLGGVVGSSLLALLFAAIASRRRMEYA